ncbi:ion channel [Chloroflexota bacterium]
MTPRERIIRVFVILFTVVATGVLGYMIIEGLSFFDALFMTIITLSTVGYNEVHPLSTTVKFSVRC